MLPHDSLRADVLCGGAAFCKVQKVLTGAKHCLEHSCNCHDHQTALKATQNLLTTPGQVMWKHEEGLNKTFNWSSFHYRSDDGDGVRIRAGCSSEFPLPRPFTGTKSVVMLTSPCEWQNKSPIQRRGVITRRYNDPQVKIFIFHTHV